VSVLRKDSLDITAADRGRIHEAVASRPHQRVVITHGTDTMTETARVLHGLDGRIIVLTGALAPARFARSDATFNVGMAFAAVQTLAPGVYIVMNGQVFQADRVRKDRARNAFVRC
jgi:L-asparaginase